MGATSPVDAVVCRDDELGHSDPLLFVSLGRVLILKVLFLAVFQVKKPFSFLNDSSVSETVLSPGLSERVQAHNLVMRWK